MARQLDKKVALADFTCQRCGKTQMLPVGGWRKYCPDCAKIMARIQVREHARQKKQQKQAEKKKLEAPKSEDVIFDERIKKQARLQCQKCHWWSKGEYNTPGDAMCTYYLRNGVGHRRDKGNGPGDCRCFEPARKRTKQERVDYCREALKRGEIENHAMKVGE